MLALIGLNPLESGQSFEWQLIGTIIATLRLVSIPSNRGSHSNAIEQGWVERVKTSLNPLESGQSFESEIVYVRNVTVEEGVSIPSNRGSHSNSRFAKRKIPGWRQSQSPRIGAVIRILFVFLPGLSGGIRLNPLESGQSFEFCDRIRALERLERVSIPSNQGSHSNTNRPISGGRIPAKSQSPRIGAVIRMQKQSGSIMRRQKVSIPSNRGSHSNNTEPDHQAICFPSLNPLESGQSFESKMVAQKCAGRGKCLNPLESGQSFE